MEEQLKGSEPLENDRFELFCQEYLKDLNAARAGREIGIKSRQNVTPVFAREDVQDRIAYLKSERAKELKIEQVDVLQRLWGIFTADPRELVKHKVVNCRNCWGVNHQYQWVDELEFDEACRQHREAELPEPMCDGGFGFRRTKPPHPECTKCDGEGKGYLYNEDTSTLSESAQLLYAGAKQTKDGIEIKMHDQMAVGKLIGQHIGMFGDKLEITGANGKDLVPPTFNIIGVKPNGDRE